jgi:N-sulfoglucosamine sulfohydrolase
LKRSAIIASLLCTLVVADKVRANVLVSEGFDYPAGQALTGKTGGFGFSGPWQGDNKPGSTFASWVTGSSAIVATAPTTGAGNYRPLTSPYGTETATAWIRWDYSQTSSGVASIIALGFFSGTTERFSLTQRSDIFRITEIGGGTSDSAAIAATNGTPQTVVARLVYNIPSNSLTISMWLNPSLVDLETDINKMVSRTMSAAHGFDGIRVFKNTEQVTGSLSNLIIADSAASLGVPAEPAPKRTNFLICMADDWGWPDAGAHGAAWLRTPNFDTLASEGVLFTNAFTNSPSCTPSRGCALTGRVPWRLGSGATLWGTLPASLPTYVDLLAADGYLPGYTGKGWGPGSVTAGGRTHNPAGPAFNSRTLSSKPASGIDNIDYAGNFELFLAQRAPGQPFCFWYGAYEPHRGYEVDSGRLKGGLDPAAVTLPDFYPDNADIRDDLLDYAWEIEHMDNHLGLMIQKLAAIGELENTVIIVTGDHGMPFPRAKKNLHELGIHVPFAVRWGEGITPGRTVHDIISFIDLAPTLLEISGTPLPAGLHFDGSSFLDLLESPDSGLLTPTTRSHAYFGIERHDMSSANNALAGIAGAGYPGRAVRSQQHLFIRNYRPTWFPYVSDSGPSHNVINSLDGGNATQQALHDLNYGTRPMEELYDVVADPSCIDNLAADPALAAVKADLITRLETYQHTTRDPRVLGYGDTFFGTPYYRDSSDRFASWDELVVSALDQTGTTGQSLASAAHLGADAAGGPPPLSVNMENGDPRFHYRLSRLMPEFNSWPMWSTDLSGWTSDGLSETTTLDGDFNLHEVQVPAPIPDRAFFRLHTEFDPAFR